MTSIVLTRVGVLETRKESSYTKHPFEMLRWRLGKNALEPVAWAGQEQRVQRQPEDHMSLPVNGDSETRCMGQLFRQ